jgi:predicted ATP-grasp superfamily ATP-dependent carboligase
VRDPAELYELDPGGGPVPNGLVMLHALDGFIDAGSAGQLIVDHLVEGLDGTVVARFDTDRLVDYRARRPTMMFATDHYESYDAPELALRLMRDAGGQEFLLLSGPEPDREWELFAGAVRELAKRFGIRLAVGFQGIPMGVPHTRPLGVTAHGTDRELLEQHPSVLGRVQVPGSADALLELRLGESGYDTAGYAVHVPHYLAQLDYPAAALTALDAVVRATGLSLPGGELEKAAERTQDDIEKQVEESDEIATVVRSLEEQYDAFVRGRDSGGLLADDSGPMPTADELAAEFERFLAERDDPGDQD